MLLNGKAGPPTRLGCGGSGGWARKWLLSAFSHFCSSSDLGFIFIFVYGELLQTQAVAFYFQEDFKRVLFDQVLSLRNLLYTPGILMLEGERQSSLNSCSNGWHVNKYIENKNSIYSTLIFKNKTYYFHRALTN